MTARARGGPVSFDLPSDIIVVIGLKLSLASHSCAAAVSMAWCRALSRADLWRELALCTHEVWPFDTEDPSFHPLFLGSWRLAYRFRRLGERASGVAIMQPAKRKTSAEMWMSGRERYTPQRRREKVPGAPKAPLSSYMLFCCEIRRRCSTGASDRCLSTKECGAAWKELQPEERDDYAQKAEVDRSRFVMERGLWVAGLSVEAFMGHEAVSRHPNWRAAYDLETHAGTSQ